ncbi:hypothetical protein J2X97_000329 [Epilithonimonas hungarica]|uniref:hypothetical protein n=1 Tax=Epilithonimonas hungarica TaxID=454006 RepID=UPI002785A8A8|nr:hypothetical protein [Epilithonimonas hungarica]MDP9954692.1 hypothetical protein [Epilithonimonas hungarica]
MLIDNTYFEGKRFIPNTSEPEINDRTTDNLQEFIESTEKDVLSYCFGFEMWEDIKEKYETKSEANPLPENYQKLIFGTSYEIDVNGEMKKFFWQGILEPDLRRSFLADIIYYNFKIDKNTQTSEFGEITAENKVGNKASITPKVVEAYNSFLAKCFGGFRGFANGLTLEGNPYWIVPNRLYNGFGLDYYGINRNNKNVSMMQFLYDNKENYPLLDLDYHRYGGERKNQFGV